MRHANARDSCAMVGVRHRWEAVVIDGPDHGRTAPLARVTRVGTRSAGREGGSCLTVTDPSVDPLHCVLVPSPWGVIVVDAGSHNGTSTGPAPHQYSAGARTEGPGAERPSGTTRWLGLATRFTAITLGDTVLGIRRVGDTEPRPKELTPAHVAASAAWLLDSQRGVEALAEIAGLQGVEALAEIAGLHGVDAPVSVTGPAHARTAPIGVITRLVSAGGHELHLPQPWAPLMGPGAPHALVVGPHGDNALALARLMVRLDASAHAPQVIDLTRSEARDNSARAAAAVAQGAPRSIVVATHAWSVCSPAVLAAGPVVLVLDGLAAHEASEILGVDVDLPLEPHETPGCWLRWRSRVWRLALPRALRP